MILDETKLFKIASHLKVDVTTKYRLKLHKWRVVEYLSEGYEWKSVSFHKYVSGPVRREASRIYIKTTLYIQLILFSNEFAV